MATSNRERIRRALELIGQSLDTFITGATRDKIPDGQSWTMLLAAKDAGKGARACPVTVSGWGWQCREGVAFAGALR